MKKIALLFLFFTVHFGFAQNNKLEVPTIVFKVPLGETIVKDGVSITFSEILEDSRCPSDVDCVWAGKSKVEVVIDYNGKKTNEVILFQKGRQKVIASTENRVFKAVSLSPYPTSATQGKLKYELLVMEEIKTKE